MDEFLRTALSFPTLPFTVAMGAVLVYWLFVIVGMVDLDAMDPGGALDGVDGALDGALDGAAEGAAEAATEGAAEGAADGDAGLGGLGGLLSALRLRYAPVTVVLSVIALLGWIGCFFGTRYVAPMLPFGAGVWGGAIVGLAALALALPLTSLVTRPMAPLFRTNVARGNRSLVGSVVVVKTGKVDRGFGQAELHDGQAGLLLRVRCEDDAGLARGDRALIVDWDEERNVFEIEPLSEVLGDDAAQRARSRVATKR